VEDYKPWLAARPGQNKPQVTRATIVHRLGTLRMFFLRVDEWGWPEAPARVPTRGGDLPGWTIRYRRRSTTRPPRNLSALRRTTNGCWCG
jgi:hypothetical protein